MKSNYIISTLCFVFLVFAASVSSASAETDNACKRDANGAIIITGPSPSNFVTDIDNNTGDSCKEIPDFYKVTFYRLGFCTANPLANNSNDLSSCTFLLNSDAGVNLELEGIGNDVVLDTSTADQPVKAGTYGFMVMLLKNELSIKHTEIFSSNIVGKTGTGTTCWTIESRTLFSGKRSVGNFTNGSIEDPGMDCGATAVPAYSTEIFDCFDDFNPNLDLELQTCSVRDEEGLARILQSDNVSTATDANNGARILVSLPQSITVTPTSRFNLAFTLTRSVSVDLAQNQDTSDYHGVKNGADPFQVALTVSN